MNSLDHFCQNAEVDGIALKLNASIRNSKSLSSLSVLDEVAQSARVDCLEVLVLANLLEYELDAPSHCF